VAIRAHLLLLLPPILACHHASQGTGSGAPGAGSPPAFSGSARYQDVDLDGLSSSGDRVVLRFSAPVALNTSDPALFALQVPGDDFGMGATVVAGPRPDEVSVILGLGARLRTRGAFDADISGYRLPSGIDLDPTAPKDALEHATSGVDVQPGSPVDLWPEPVPGIQSGLGPIAFDAATGDLDRDARADLVVAAGEDGVGVYESVDGGGFVALDLPVGNALKVALVDLNRSGRLDLVALTTEALKTFENVSVAGGWVELDGDQDLPLPEPMVALATIDMDDDGDVDLVTTGASGLWVFENDGVLVPPTAPLLGSPGGSRDLAVGDLDRNGWDDLLIALPGQTVVMYSFVCGSVQFSAVGTKDSAHVALADIDRDGRLDAVSAGEGPIEVWFGAPSGLLEHGYDIEVDATTALALLDIDGDDALDLIHSDGLATRMAQGDGAGGLQDFGAKLSTGGANTVASGDVDADGDLDLLFAADGRPQIWASSLTGTWGIPHFRDSAADAGVGPLLIAELADLNGVGTLDLISGHNERIELRPGLGDGSFGAPAVIGLPDARAHEFKVGAVDGDGDADLVAAIIGPGPGLWLQSGGMFFPHPLEPEGTVLLQTSVELTDLDGDGFLEIIAGTLETVPDRLYANGGGACSPAPGDQTYWNGYEPGVDLRDVRSTLAVLARDFDLDGDQDVLFGRSDGPDQLYENVDGALLPSGVTFADENTVALDAGDTDGDGDMDIVTGMPAGNLVYLGDGAGGFIQGGPINGIETSSVVLAHLDGDELLDVVFGHRTIQGWEALRGTPDGLFSAPSWQHETSFALHAVLAGDLDRDGATDFITGARHPGSPHRVWLSR